MTAQTVFGQPGTPATLVSDTGAYTMGMQFSLSQSTPLTGIWFYSAPGAGALPDHCGIFAVSGQGIVSGTGNNSPSWSGAAGSGWVKCTYDGSTTLASGTSYKVAVSYAGGSNWYSATSHYWDSGAGSSGLVSGVITAPNNAGGDGGQDTFASAGSLTYPSSSFNAGNYWVDVEVTTAAPVVPFALRAPLMPPGRQSPAAWQFQRRPQMGQTSPPSITGSGGVRLPKPTLAGAGTVTAGTSAPVKRGSWYQLLDIREQARQEFDYYAERPPASCPLDGEPLRNAPTVASASGCELFCRFCGWQYPRDWVRPERL